MLLFLYGLLIVLFFFWLKNHLKIEKETSKIETLVSEYLDNPCHTTASNLESELNVHITIRWFESFSYRRRLQVIRTLDYKVSDYPNLEYMVRLYEYILREKCCFIRNYFEV